MKVTFWQQGRELLELRFESPKKISAAIDGGSVNRFGATVGKIGNHIDEITRLHRFG
jgi:hypothetical protein